MKKIKFIKKPGYYNGTYPEGAIVEVDDAFADYAIGMEDAILAKPSDSVTDPTPYIMAPRRTGSEDALQVIANALSGVVAANAAKATEKPVTK